jgi:lysophospholipase L1-like esterase
MARTPPQPVSLKRLLLVLAILYCGLSGWRGQWLFSVQGNEAKFRAYSALAERLAGTPRQNAPWARRLLKTFGGMDRYREANSSLPPATAGRVVLYGDSITDYWVTRAPETFFPGHGYIGRGIAGQATPELLWRFQEDALDLHPNTIVLLGGANDIILKGRRIPDAETRDNLRRMIVLARQRGIRVVLCSLLPVHYDQPERQRLYTARIEALNAWLRGYATANHLRYVDYFDALAGPQGAMPLPTAPDGLHPTAAGYRIMQQLLQKALDTTQ